VLGVLLARFVADEVVAQAGPVVAERRSASPGHRQ